MITLNVSFGIYAFLPQGWIFMIAIILIECLGLSKLLTTKWNDTKIYTTVFISNLISGIEQKKYEIIQKNWKEKIC